MANTYKNIVISPNISTNATVVPMIQFSGGDATKNTDITLKVYTTQNGTLAFEGSSGQLFSITNDMTNSIFSVNDVSGIPSIDVYANGTVYIAPFGGNVSIGMTDNMRIGSGVSIGTSTDPGANNLIVNGNVILTGATAGLGYGTGSGGIVSQATSKVTGVTLNKLVGAVAANSAALASNTVASFTVTNNLVAASDVVIVNRLNGGTAGAYQISCDSVSAGSFVISMLNTTTGSLSERVVIGFAVIKAVQA